ncbi:MAG: Crp/Fnr family transcriptional regulator [Actinomycetia bacterium]|nr:Crp/Fnr family transcriptional regulator [Actinomycetes bacterium]
MPTTEDYNLLIHLSPLFQGISADELAALLDCLGVRRRSYRKGSYIFTAGQHITDMGLLLSGQLDILQDDVWGNRRILERVTAGEMFGTAFTCADIARIPISVQAIQPSEVMLFDYRKVITTCNSACGFHTQLISNMLRLLASKSVSMMDKIENVTRRSTREKLLSFLSQQAHRRQTRSFDIPFNRQELAEYLAVDRSALSTELGRLRDEGVLRFHKNHFELRS